MRQVKTREKEDRQKVKRSLQHLSLFYLVQVNSHFVDGLQPAEAGRGQGRRIDSEGTKWKKKKVRFEDKLCGRQRENKKQLGVRSSDCRSHIINKILQRHDKI